MRAKNTSSTLESNLESLQQRIGAAAIRSHRSPSSIHLLAVTKKVDFARIAELAALGIRDVGENRVQDLIEKKAQIQMPLRWHLIGSLQKNKSRKALAACETIHSADSAELLATLDRIGQEIGKNARLFLEVNVSGEASKHGVSPQETLALLREARKLPHVEMLGLMTMAPLAKDPESSRPIFRRLRELRDRAAEEGYFSGAGELSMGMTQDFEIAIEEGATWIRVGSALFEGIG